MISLIAIAILTQRPDNSEFNAGPAPMLFKHPTMNETDIVFGYANALWRVAKTGGAAARITTGPMVLGDPYFSPDGKWIAFSADYDGNVDAYVMPAEGGSPKRLTSHPSPDLVQGWSPDSKSVLFCSTMLSNTDAPRLFTVPVTGGFPKALLLPSAYMGSYSPDGTHLAYVPHDKWETAWKRYRGGQTYPIWIADLSTSKVKSIPRENTNDEQPMWVGDKVYYLSDKRGPVGLYSYDLGSGKEEEEIKGSGFDIKSATYGPGGIVYEKLGSIRIYDLKSKTSHQVPITVAGDFLEVRPQFKNVAKSLDGTSLSPSGSRVAVSARGWIFTAPAAKGDVRLVNTTQGVHRRDPAWSPDGTTIAYFSDAAGDQKLSLVNAVTGKEILIGLGDAPGFYHNPVWSPDSKMVAYIDNKNRLWSLEISSGKNTKIDESIFDNPVTHMTPAWSPDSKWLTWSRDLENHLNAVFLYSFGTGKKTQITDGLSDALSPVFDRGGKYLYFYASTEVGIGASWLDISSYTISNSRSAVYAVVLGAKEPNPLHPESDEEVLNSGTTSAPLPKPDLPLHPVVIDLEGIEQRTIALPLPPSNYFALRAGPAGSLFTLGSSPRAYAFSASSVGSLVKFSFTDRKIVPFASDVSDAQLTPDGSKALITTRSGLSIVPTIAPPTPGQGVVNLSDLTVKINPREEWTAMYHEVWRNERMLFYSPILNGIDSQEIEKRYEPFLANLQSREDLNYLFDDMLGELCVGHEFPGGGDLPEAPEVEGGLLGADFTFDSGRYRITRIYDGERWNPTLYAPLAQPGIEAKVGEYVLAIDGKDLTEATDLYDALEAKAGKQIALKIGPNSSGAGSRVVIVVPVANEFGLRSQAWEEDNRRYVAKMTNGRAGYVHVPDTNVGGWQAFTRYYYSQVGKDAMVVDERFNHGGLINDYMVREMLKPMDAAFKPRYGQPWPTPGAAIFGPKVLLINEYSGSGGDMFPWLFRHEKVGKIIGKRTWGGLIAAFGFNTIDGGHINSPDIAFYNSSAGTWDVENWGVSPDEDVDLDPVAWRAGHDAQLDTAIAELNHQLLTYVKPKLDVPPYPDRTKLNKRF